MATNETSYKLYIRPNGHFNWELFSKDSYLTWEKLIDAAREQKEQGEHVAYAEGNGRIVELAGHELR